MGGQPGLDDNLRDAVHGHAEKQLVGHFRPITQHRDFPRRVEGLHQVVLDERDAALREGGEDGLRRVG